MASFPNRSKPLAWRRSARRASADDPATLLVFSCVGLLVDVVALLVQGAAHSVPLHFALVAGAAPVAALVARWLADRADAGGC
ncbi:hypothetical protein J6500_16410 [Bradyrhizobium sp. WSM 1704]|uniref:hypothetical protein n=1 Tax=Bradyrhizobium semiaridum TaxID=2821404 RepID=UPI001CE2555D|nr:hypothetical protein [Bradyrhizobium semiaridum]MCA6123466.1 hypothetical protein [Bradyrhizobium semiaridum]